MSAVLPTPPPSSPTRPATSIPSVPPARFAATAGHAAVRGEPSFSALRSAREERRQCRRRSLKCPIALIDTQGEPDAQADVISARCLEISENGLYAVVPLGCGVARGQRYTFHLCTGERGPGPYGRQTISQQGLVVRTELLINMEGAGDQVGIAVKLLGRRCGHISMPSEIM